MVGKTISYRVFICNNNTKKPRNDFKVCIFNKNGVQLAPNPGKDKPIHDPTWMFCTTESNTFSSTKHHTFTE